MSVRLSFTDHAVDRYIERHEPAISRVSARIALEYAATKTVVRVGRALVKGDIFMLADLGNLQVIAVLSKGEHVVTTVLHRAPDVATWTPQEMQEEIAASDARLAAMKARVDAEDAEEARLAAHAKALAALPGPTHNDRRALVRDQIKLARERREALQWEARILAAHEKTVRHAINSSTNETRLRLAIRLVMRHLADGTGTIAETIEAVRAIDPTLTHTDFYRWEQP